MVGICVRQCVTSGSASVRGTPRSGNLWGLFGDQWSTYSSRGCWVTNTPTIPGCFAGGWVSAFNSNLEPIQVFLHHGNTIFTDHLSQNASAIQLLRYSFGMWKFMNQIDQNPECTYCHFSAQAQRLMSDTPRGDDRQCCTLWLISTGAIRSSDWITHS